MSKKRFEKPVTITMNRDTVHAAMASFLWGMRMIEDYEEVSSIKLTRQGDKYDITLVPKGAH